jgi:hypothetical protein
MRIPIRIVTSNEYVKNNWPKIEIVIGRDYKNYWTFANPVNYLPKIENPIASGATLSGENKNTLKNQSTKNNTPTPAQSNTTPYKVTAGSWEEL